MNGKSKRLLTLMLAGALCAATVGGVVTKIPANADATKTSDELTSIFESTGATVASGTLASKETAKFTLEKDGRVEYDNDLALAWYQKEESTVAAKYMNFTFAFGDLNFEDVSFVFEATPYQAVKGDKAINTIKFVNESGAISVKVYAGEDEPENGTPVTVAAEQFIAIELGAGAEAGEFDVKLNGTPIGSFTNIGSNYAEADDVEPFVVKATPTGENTAIYLTELNGQAFDNIENGKVEDTAAPVLVVNQDVNSFLLGTQFSLDYEKIDVLKGSGSDLSETKKYYQWNPTDTEVEEKTFSTNPFFMDTVYEEGGVNTSVYRKYGAEYVSIKFVLDDKSGVDAATYDLSWYATGTVKQTVGTEEREYIKIDRNEEGPTYKYVTAVAADPNDPESKNRNEVSANLATALENYQKELDAEADKVYAGTNSEFKVPALDWLIEDNNGFKGLKFSLSYKKPDSNSGTSVSDKSQSALEIPTTKEGVYEFKVLAKDALGNAMKYYLNEELVEVTTSNIWDIEEIPSFKFEVKNKGIKPVDDEDDEVKDRLTTKIKDENYTMSAVKIEGASNVDDDYTLYKLDVNGLDANVANILAKITFKALDAEADSVAKDKAFDNRNYMEIYKEAFINLAASELKISKSDLKERFEKIDEYNSELGEKEGDNKFNWSASSRRFTTANEGVYLILADYWDTDLPAVDRVPAYQLIEVSEEVDTIKGISKWLQNNLTSIILFSIAGVLGVAIVVLLLVKPSDETLEDVDKKAKK